MKKYRLILMAVLFSTGLISCSSDDDSTVDVGNEDTASLRIELTDAPGDFEQVLIEIEDVMVQTEASMEAEGETEADEEGWVSLEGVVTGTYNLLELTGGKTQLLANAELPAGRLNQIRLVLGTENIVVVNGEPHILETPSAEQSGLKLQVNQNLEAGADYFFLLDFDVEESIVEAGDQFILKPVIRVSTEEAGTIAGSVTPTEYQVLVEATNEETSVSAYADENGNFQLNGLSEGTYTVTVTPDEESGLLSPIVDNVSVVSGEITDMGVISLE